MSFNRVATTFSRYLDALHHSTIVGQRLCWSSCGLLLSAWCVSITVVSLCSFMDSKYRLIASVLVILRMYRYRRDFSQVLASADSSMTRHRFMRLFLMSFVLIVLIFPVECFVLYKNLSVPFESYSWDRVHSKEAWQHISFVPTYGAVSFDRWIQIGMGFGIFLFFGTGPDAVSLYRKFLLKLGLGKIFTSLNDEPSKRKSSSASGSHASSVGSRARLVIAKTFKGASYFLR